MKGQINNFEFDYYILPIYVYVTVNPVLHPPPS